MPVNESQWTLRTLAKIYSGLNEIEVKGEEIVFDPRKLTQDKMFFLIWYYFRIAQLKKELDQIEENILWFYSGYFFL